MLSSGARNRKMVSAASVVSYFNTGPRSKKNRRRSHCGEGIRSCGSDPPLLPHPTLPQHPEYRPEKRLPKDMPCSFDKLPSLFAKRSIRELMVMDRASPLTKRNGTAFFELYGSHWYFTGLVHWTAQSSARDPAMLTRQIPQK